MYIDCDKFNLSILRSHDVLKLSKCMRDNVNYLTNNVVATSGSGFKLSSVHEKPDDNVLKLTKNQSQQVFLELVHT